MFREKINTIITIGFVVSFIFLVLRVIFGDFLKPLDTSFVDTTMESLPKKGHEAIVLVDIEAKTKKELNDILPYPSIWLPQFLERCRKAKAVGIAIPLTHISFPSILKEIPEPKLDSLAVVARIPRDGLSNILGALSDYLTFEKMIESLKESNVFFGVNFLEEKYSDELLILSEPIKRKPKLGMFEMKDFIAPPTNWLKESKGVGFLNIEPDPDGVVRKIPMLGVLRRDTLWKIKRDTLGPNDGYYLSFPLHIARNYWGVEKVDFPRYTQIKLDKKLINTEENLYYRPYFFGDYKDFNPLTLLDVLKSKNIEEKFKNKIVILGSSLEKKYATPIASAMPGFVIHSNVLASLLSEKGIVKSGLIVDFIFCLILSTAASFSVFFKKWLISIPSFLGLLFLFYFYVFFSIAGGNWISFYYPLFSAFTTFFAAFLIWFITQGKDTIFLRSFIKEHFGEEKTNLLLEKFKTLPYITREKGACICMYFEFEERKKSLRELADSILELENSFETIVFKHEGIIIDTSTQLFIAKFHGEDAARKALLSTLELRSFFKTFVAKAIADKIATFKIGIGIAGGTLFGFRIKGLPEEGFISIAHSITRARELAILSVELRKYILMDETILASLPENAVKEEVGELTILGEKTKVYEFLRI